MQVLDDIMVANEIFVRHGRRGGGTMLSFTHAAAFQVKRGNAGSFQTICLLRRHLDSEMHMSSEREEVRSIIDANYLDIYIH